MAVNLLGNVDKVLKDRGYDPSAQTNVGSGIRSFGAAPANATQDFFGNVRKSLGAIPGGIANFAKDTAKSTIDVARFGGQALSSIQNASVAKKQAQIMQSRRDSAIKDFKSGKITKDQFNKAIFDLNKSSTSQNFDATTKSEAKASKEFTGKKVATDYAKFAGAALTVAAPFAAPVTAAAEGANVATQVGTKIAQGLDYGFGAGAVPKAMTIPRVGAKIVGTAIDANAIQNTIGDAAKGKFDPLNTALTATAFVPGGPVGLVEKLGSGAASLANKALYSKSGVFDKIAIKGGTILSEAEKIADPKARAKVEGTLKQFQDFLLQQHGTPKRAAAAFTDYVAEHKNLTLDQVVSEMSSFKNAATQADKIAAKAKAAKQEITVGGKVINPAEGQIRVGKTKQADISAVTKILKSSDNTEQAIAQIRKDFPELASNKRNQAILDEIVSKKLKGEEAAGLIRSKFIGTNPILVDGKPMTFPGGYYAFYTPKDYARFNKVAETGPLLKSTTAPLGKVGEVLDKAGLSTQSANPQEQKSIFAKVRKAFNESVDTMGIQSNGETLSGQKVFNKLNEALKTKAGTTDIRQLRWKEVQEALGSNDAQAKQVLKAYKDSFKTLSVSERGLGGKITDFNLRVNPVAAPYSRIQSVARYEKNPFFRAQENIETRLGTAAFTGVNAKPGHDYTETIDALKNTNLFAGGGFGSEGAAEFANITAKLSKDQQRNIAAGVEALAGSKDTKQIMDFVKKNPDLMENLRAVVQYPDKGLTSSNLMKALNLVAFPARYNLKVTQYALKALGKEHGIRQMAVLSGFRNFQEWQKTPEGIKWNSDNAEALGLMRYFTPIGSIESVYRTLTGETKNIRDLGTIGGLPFGLISGVLQGQGVINTDSPYLDPKTGEVVPSKLPEDAKARLKQAISDVINTMYTFPGRQVNAPSKKSLSDNAADIVSFGTLKNGKTKSVTRTDLTPEQRKKQQVLRSANNSKPVSLSKPANTNFKPLTSDKPLNIQPIYKKGSKGKKAKNFAPRLSR